MKTLQYSQIQNTKVDLNKQEERHIMLLNRKQEVIIKMPILPEFINL